MPAPDPAFKRAHLDLPLDLVGGEARDVLAAEEFAMPAPSEARRLPRLAVPKQRSLVGAALLVAASAAAGIWSHLRRRGG